jgi:hypothetical protein
MMMAWDGATIAPDSTPEQHEEIAGRQTWMTQADPIAGQNLAAPKTPLAMAATA